MHPALQCLRRQFDKFNDNPKRSVQSRQIIGIYERLLFTKLSTAHKNYINKRIQRNMDNKQGCAKIHFVINIL